VLRAAVFGWGVILAFVVYGIQWLTVGTLEGDDKIPFGEHLRKHPGIVMFTLFYALIYLVYLGTFVWAGVRRDRRGLHDRISGTRVIYDVGSRGSSQSSPQITRRRVS
jgi:hypothetical protein